MWKDSRENAGAAMSGDAMPGADALAKSPEGGRPLAARGPVSGRGITAQSLGSAEFKSAYGVKYAYASGAMYRGIASSQMVVRMAKAGMLSFLGTGGLPLTKIAEEIAAIQSQLKNGEAFGVNLLFQPSEPWIEEEQVDFYIKERIRCAEVSAYMQSLSAPLVKYRLSGAVRNGDGTVTVPNKVLAKLSRPEVATAFLSPPPPALVAQLREQNKITAAEAEIGVVKAAAKASAATVLRVSIIVLILPEGSAPLVHLASQAAAPLTFASSEIPPPAVAPSPPPPPSRMQVRRRPRLGWRPPPI